MHPGCALCGQLVESPHYCEEHLARAHCTILRHNAEYHAACAEQLASELDQNHTPDTPRVGIVDLAEWGDWMWSVESGLAPQGVNLAAARRAARVIARLTVHQRRELRSVYVVRCEATRGALRCGKPLPGEKVPRVKAKLPAFTVAERAYLTACRT